MINRKFVYNSSVLLIVFIFLILPIFVQIFFPLLNIPLYNPFIYSVLLFFLLVVYSKVNCQFQFTKAKYFLKNRLIKSIIIFNISLISILILKGLYSADFIDAYRLLIPFVGSLLLIYYFKYNGDLDNYNYKVFFDHFSIFLGIFAIFQLIYSIYESATGSYFINSKSLGIIGSRDILNLFGSSLTNIFGIRYVFGGSYFHHNVFGTILVLYNLIFLIRFYESRKKIFILYIFVTFFLSLGNTSRFAIFAIIFSNLFIYYRMLHNKIRYIIIPIVIIFIYFYINPAIQAWDLYFYQTDSLQTRTYIWKYIFDIKIPNMKSLEYILGVNIHDLLHLDVGIQGKTSLENTYLLLFFGYGFFGFLFFLILYNIYPLLKLPVLNKFNRTVVLLFVLNIVFPSLVGATYLYFPCYILLTILFLRITIYLKTNP